MYLNTYWNGRQEDVVPTNLHRAKKQSGFTLIELLVVIAIIAILAAILFPVFAQAKISAKASASLSNAQQIGLSVLMYADDYDDHFVIGGQWHSEDQDVPKQYPAYPSLLLAGAFTPKDDRTRLRSLLQSIKRMRRRLRATWPDLIIDATSLLAHGLAMALGSPLLHWTWIVMWEFILRRLLERLKRLLRVGSLDELGKANPVGDLPAEKDQSYEEAA